MKVILLFFATLFSIVPSYSQPGNASNTEQEIKKLSNDWMIATMKKDEITLNKLVAPEFKLGGTNFGDDNPPLPRAIWMKNTLENLKIDSINYIKMKIEIIDNVAIVQSVFFWSVSFKGNSVIKDTGTIIDTWLKRKEGWQVVSRLLVDK